MHANRKKINKLPKNPLFREMSARERSTPVHKLWKYKFIIEHVARSESAQIGQQKVSLHNKINSSILFQTN